MRVRERAPKKMGKKTKKAGKGKEKTEKKTAKAEEKRARRETKKLSPEDDIDAILVLHSTSSILVLFSFLLSSLIRKQQNLNKHIFVFVLDLITQSSIQKEEAKKKEIHVEDNVPAPSPRSNCSVTNRK